MIVWHVLRMTLIKCLCTHFWWWYEYWLSRQKPSLQ